MNVDRVLHIFMKMRVWDLPPGILCRKHLLGEHREIHAIWAILTGGRKGYSRHPETLRWKGRLRALYIRHGRIAGELGKRGYRHSSPLDENLARGAARQTKYVNTVEEQKEILKGKGCECRV